MRLRCHALTALTAATMVLGLALPALRAQQAPQPVALVSMAPLDRLLSNTSYMLRACNVPEMGGLVSIMANQYTQGVDRTKPFGAMVTLEGQTPSVLIFMPMTDRDAFFGSLSGLGIEPDDLGDGLFEIFANGQTIFAKDAGEWMFIAQSEDALASLPEDPASKLGNLPSRYDVAVRLNVQSLPTEMKQMVTEQMRIGFERGMADQGDQTDEELKAAQEMGEASIAQIEKLINETEQVIVGWAVDSSQQVTYFDGGAQFIEGSDLAMQANAAANMVSDYTAFILPGASAKFRFSSMIADADKPVAKNNLQNSISQVEAQLAQNDDLPSEAKEMVMELVKGLAKLSEQTIDEGILDGAGSVSVTDETLRALIGGRIADGNALAAEFKKAVAKFPAGADVPTVEFDYETYKGVTLHKATVPLKIADPAAKKVFGESLNVVIGTADKGFLLALDPAGDAAVKAAIDAMSASMGQKVSPLESVIAFTDLLKFAQAISPNSIVDNAIGTMSEYAGKDTVKVNGSVIPRGGIYRVSVDEGVMRAIGAAAKSGGGGGGGF